MMRNTDEAVNEQARRFKALTIATSELIYQMSADWREMRHLNSRGFLKNTLRPDRNWLSAYIPPEEQAFVLSAIHKAIELKDIFQFEHRVYSADGRIGWVYSRAVPLLDSSGEIIEWFGAASDITGRKAAEENQLRQQDELLQLVDKLRKAEENRTTFLNSLSHELRNPLAAISASLELINYETYEDTKILKTMSIIGRQTKQLVGLIDDLLDLTRIIQNKIVLKKEPVELNELLYDICLDTQPQSNEKRISIEYKKSPEKVIVQADPVRITEAVSNLLNNAIKFSNYDDTIQVCLDVNQEKKQAMITVQDSGSGVAPFIQDSIFEPFFQGDNSLDHGSGGLGLGLAIVKGLMEMHGGEVKLFSEGKGQGSRFILVLPLAENQADQSTVNEINLEIESRCFNILVIEDLPELAELTAELLISAGHRVRTALNGADGIRLAKVFRPDILICDIGLPEMSGYEIAETFADDTQLKDVYRIALSGYAQPEDFERSKKAGFHRHVAKPVSFDLLARILNEIPENR